MGKQLIIVVSDNYLFSKQEHYNAFDLIYFSVLPIIEQTVYLVSFVPAICPHKYIS